MGDCIDIPSMLLLLCHSCQIRCSRSTRARWNESQPRLMGTKHMGKQIRGESRCVCSFRWPADWLIMWVLAGDLLMGCLMRVDYTAWLSPSLHASHDNSVSVTPFNPITPTRSDTNSITPFLLCTRSSLLPWFSDTHSVTGLFFYSLMSWMSAAGCISLPPFCLLSFNSLVCFFFLAQQGKLRTPDNQTSKPCPMNLFL